MTHRLTTAEYRALHDRLGQMAPIRPGVKATPAAFRRLQSNAADPVKARKRKAPVGRDSNVLRAITDYLDLEVGPEGRGWFRMNSGVAFVQARNPDAALLPIRLAPEGTADLLAIIPARRIFWGMLQNHAVPFWIEVKRLGGLTDREGAVKQWEFRQYMQTIGCIAIEARSLEDVTAILPPRGSS